MTGMGRREYLRAIYERYRRSSKEKKGAILDEFCRVPRLRRVRGMKHLPALRAALQQEIGITKRQAAA